MSITDKIRKFTNRIKNTDGDYDLVSYDTDASTVYTDYKNKKTLDTKITEMDEATNSRIDYGDIDNPYFVELEKVYDGQLKKNHQAQGMAYDPGRKLFYMASFDHVDKTKEQDRSQRIITIDVISEETLTLKQQYTTSTAGHFNNLNYINRDGVERLIASCANNTSTSDDYRQMGIISISGNVGSMSFSVKPIALNEPSWCILPFIPQENSDYNYNISYLTFTAANNMTNGSPYAKILNCVEGHTNKYYSISKLNLPSSNGIIQGGDIKDGIVYKLYSYTPVSTDKQYSRNSIQVFGLNGSYYNTIYLKYDSLFEAEDICVLDDGTLYVNDMHGNIYKGNIAKLKNEDYAYSFRYPVNALSDIILYDYSLLRSGTTWTESWKNGTENWSSKGTSGYYLLNSVCMSPFVYPSVLNSISGTMCVNGQYVPISYYRVPKSSTSTDYYYYISGQAITYTNSGKVIISQLTYYIGSDSSANDKESYRFVLDTKNTWVGSVRQILKDGKIENEVVTSTGMDVINHANCNGDWYICNLTGKQISNTHLIDISF